jgi:hypothetical protein
VPDWNCLLVSRRQRLHGLLLQSRSRDWAPAKLRTPPWKAPPASNNAKAKSHPTCGTHGNLRWGEDIEGIMPLTAITFELFWLYSPTTPDEHHFTTTAESAPSHFPDTA